MQPQKCPIMTAPQATLPVFPTMTRVRWARLLLLIDEPHGVGGRGVVGQEVVKREIGRRRGEAAGQGCGLEARRMAVEENDVGVLLSIVPRRNSVGVGGGEVGVDAVEEI